MKSEFDHMMVDLETLGTTGDSVIMSIAAIPFNIESGATDEPFYANISIQSCLDHGLTVEGSTVAWWMQQDDVAIRRLFEGTAHLLGTALADLSTKFGLYQDLKVWGNSARFDLGILEHAYAKAELRIPWEFRNERDVRTLVSFAPDIKKEMKFEGTPHNAIDDCLHQIKYCSAIWKAIKEGL